MIAIVQNRVRDCDPWELVFDEHQAIRTRHGVTGHELYRSPGDPNEITTVSHFPSREQSEASSSEPSLKEAMDIAGVISEPRFTWADETEAVDNTAKVV